MKNAPFPFFRILLRRDSRLIFFIMIFSVASFCDAGAPDGAFVVKVPALAAMPVGGRIAYWARTFVGTPYDTDPLGRYVRQERIAADDAVDCMYLTFRSAELALGRTPGEAIEKALDLRFITKGRLDNGRVTNYEERFRYGEDMIDSGKWGQEITSGFAGTIMIKGARGRGAVTIIPAKAFLKAVEGNASLLHDGDIVFFITSPEKRTADEIVGHIGVIEIRDGAPYLIHAGGKKDTAASKGNGIVKSVKLTEYARRMRFIGVRLTRFKETPG